MQRRPRGGFLHSPRPLSVPDLVNTPSLPSALPAPAAGYFRLRFYPTYSIHRAAQERDLPYKNGLERNEEKQPQPQPQACPQLIASVRGGCRRPAFYARARGRGLLPSLLPFSNMAGPANASLAHAHAGSL